MHKVLMVGSDEKSSGGVSSVLRLYKEMPVWEKYSIYWLGTQIQRNYILKLWYAFKGNLIALLKLWRYSIIHFHTTTDILGLLIQLPILLQAKILHKKTILHLHVGNQLKTRKNKLFSYCLSKADLIILLAPKWAESFSEYYPEIDVPTTVLSNPCADISNVDRASKEKVIIMAAWLSENKGTDVLLKALKTLRDNHFTELNDWKVAILGKGEEERFRAMADELGLSDIVEFTGYITGPLREEYFRKASIYCMCSYEEGFPMVVLESWAYGIALITTPVGGLPDVIEEEKNCLTFDFGDVEGLSARLRRLMLDREMRDSMADYSRGFVTDRFSVNRINDELDRIYQSL